MLQPIAGGREAVPNYGNDERLQPAGAGSLFDFRELRAILRRRKWVAVAVFVATVLAALLYVLFVPPKYLATALILSGMLMLRYLKEIDAANRLEQAVAAVIAEGKRVTYDLKPNRSDPTAVGTREMAEAICEKL